MKTVSTFRRTHTIRRPFNARYNGEIIGELWEKGPDVMLNPSHIVSQSPVTWNDDKGNTVDLLEVKTVIGDVFFVPAKA